MGRLSSDPWQSILCNTWCASFILNDKQRVKWAKRIISFKPNEASALSDGTPLGGTIVWKSRRIFPREHPGVRISEIARVKRAGKVGAAEEKLLRVKRNLSDK